jgi:type VI secretion system protein ImpA
VTDPGGAVPPGALEVEEGEMALDIQSLISPIAGANPAGEEASMLEEFDAMREARRADDPTLSQGDWKTELKAADWRQALELSTAVLANKSKDLQVAAWMTEAAAARHGFAGLAEGLRATAAIIDGFWDTLHPAIDGGDLEMRVARLAWLDSNVANVVRRTPLTAPPQSFGLLKWQESREVDNLARQNPAAAQAALADGKITGEQFDKAIRDTPNETLLKLREEIKLAADGLGELKGVVDARFGREAPRFNELGETLKRCAQVVSRTAAEKGLVGAAEAPTEGGTAEGAAAPGGAVLALGPLALGDTQAAKQAALAQLTQIAEFFRKTEPHSPVTFLIQQAVRWANTPLDQWLGEVIKEEATLGRLREMLGIQAKQ